MAACALLTLFLPGVASAQSAKPPIRGLISMGAYKFVGSGGPPINTVHNNKPRTMGRFWSPPYRKAWAELQNQLAALYDNEPLIRDVAITSCMSYTAEPFFLPTSEDEEATVLVPLQQAGFTPAAYRYCLTNAVNDYAAWQQSRLVFPFNPFRAAVYKGSGAGTGPGNHAFTMKVMANCRQAVGARCVFDNHDLNAPLNGALHPVYTYMSQLGGPIEFQTANATPNNFPGTIKLGVRYGAQAIELYQDYKGFPLVPNGQLRKWAAMLENGAP